MQNSIQVLSAIKRHRVALFGVILTLMLVAALAMTWQTQASFTPTHESASLGLAQTNDGCIDGYVYAVVNGLDIGLGNWTVHAQLQNGTGPVYNALTRGNGYFLFRNLPRGVYKVWVDLPSGWVLYPGTTNPIENVYATSASCVTVLFKLQQGTGPGPTPEPATRIDGYVYEETCDGIIPYEGALLEVWSSSLPDSLDSLVQSRNSDAAGYFNFHILPSYLADYFHLLLKVPSDMEVISTIAPEGIVVGPDHIRFDFPGIELLSGNQFILREKGLMCETPTPTPTPTITPTPTPFKLYLPIILTRPPMCEVGYLYVNIWGKEYHIPLYDVPYVYMLHPLPWQYSTTFYLKEYEGDTLWTQYDPFYNKQEGGYEFTYPGGHAGQEFTLYVVTECGEIAIMSNIDDPTPTPQPTPIPGDQWTVLMDQDFDNGGVGDADRIGSPTWGLAACESASEPYSLWPAARGSHAAQPCQENYPGNMDSWIIYGPFDLSDADSAQVTFDYLLDTEKGQDWFGWYASSDNVHFSGLRESGNTNGWASQTFDLKDWVGQKQVWIAFVFQSNEYLSGKGAFLDNVLVRKFKMDRPPRAVPHQATRQRVPAPDVDSAIEPASLIRQ